MTGETQLAGVLGEAGELSLQRVAMPQAGPNDLLVEIVACGICGSDLNYWRRGSLPVGSIPGHEFAGVVVEVGERVAGFALGDVVTADPMTHRFGLGDAPGAFTEFLSIANPRLEETVFKLPPDLPSEIACMAEPLAVGLHGVEVGAPKPGDRIVVLGGGTIGLCVVVALRSQGFDGVVLRDPSALRRDAASSLGARAVEASAPWAHGADAPTLVFDCAGVAAALLEAQAAIAAGGRTVILASYAGAVALDLHELMLRESAVVGAVGYGGQFPRAIAMVKAQPHVMQKLISHHFPLERLVDAFRAQADAAQSLKVIVDMPRGG